MNVNTDNQISIKSNLIPGSAAESTAKSSVARNASAHVVINRKLRSGAPIAAARKNGDSDSSAAMRDDATTSTHTSPVLSEESPPTSSSSSSPSNELDREYQRFLRRLQLFSGTSFNDYQSGASLPSDVTVHSSDDDSDYDDYGDNGYTNLGATSRKPTDVVEEPAADDSLSLVKPKIITTLHHFRFKGQVERPRRSVGVERNELRCVIELNR